MTNIDSTEKVRDNRLRRTARRQGLKLYKSHSRDPQSIDYGGWMIANADNVLLAGGSPVAFSMTTDEVEGYLYADEIFVDRSEVGAATHEDSNNRPILRRSEWNGEETWRLFYGEVGEISLSSRFHISKDEALVWAREHLRGRQS